MTTNPEASCMILFYGAIRALMLRTGPASGSVPSGFDHG
jgi:hypothetical protein